MQQYHKKVRGRFVQNPASQFPAVLHTALLREKEEILPNINVTSQILQVRLTEEGYAHPKIRKPIGLVKKDLMRK